MSDHDSAGEAQEYSPPVKPADAREWTMRGIIVALLVAAVIGASYPYIVLKLGFGPNIAVVSAFFGYLLLALFAGRTALRFESNLAQAAGTIAGQTAFMCTIMAAFDMLMIDKVAGFESAMTPWQIFSWLTTAGMLGVFLAVPMRRHFVVDEKLPYADGLAAGEALIVLDARGAEAKNAIISLILGMVSSAGVAFLFMRAFIHEEIVVRINRFSNVTHTGFSTSLLMIGSGMIIGLRICANMFVGLILAWVIAPVLLADAGIIAETATKRDILLWVMWPATGMMIAGGLTALVLKWRVLSKSFKSLTGARVDSGDMPMRHVLIGIVLSGIGVVLVQKLELGMPIGLTLLALLFTIPLMLVGLRVLGETNWGPISALSNLMQAVFGVVSPGNIPANMAASGLTGTIVADSEGLMQSYRTGHLIGSTPRYLTYIQLMAVPVGALMVAIMYPILRENFGFTGDNALSSPISQKWVGFAKLLGLGLDALHPSAFAALGIAVVLGVVFTVLEQFKSIKRWVPSPTGIGIGMLVPATAVATMFIGAVIDVVWRSVDKKSPDSKILPLASGFIAGEAVIVVVLSILYATKVLHLPG
ncbi:MAG: OPT/YSL family transporter [Planctomycetes bacterium]|nr:OPT/YSL family transporter [Planctomycetota bacterium]